MTIIISKVLRNSYSEQPKADRQLLQDQCRAAVAKGGYFTIEDKWTENDWYTVYTITLPETINET